MKLLRLKITDPKGFRSLPCDFEHYFRKKSSWQDELDQGAGFVPFVCAGPNGSGKSNLLEVLAAIFYHMECMYLDNLPDSFRYDEEGNPKGFRSDKATPDGFELEYLIGMPKGWEFGSSGDVIKVCITKQSEETPKWLLFDKNDQELSLENLNGKALSELLPEYVLGYSSGENEILSLPFLKMRFVQFDEYWAALAKQSSYSGRPENRMVYLDNSFSQAILLCNLLFQDNTSLQPLREEVGIEAIKMFRIILKRSITIDATQLDAFDLMSDDQKQERRNRIKAQLRVSERLVSDSQRSVDEMIRQEIINSNPALQVDVESMDTTRYRLNLLLLLEGGEKSSKAVSALKRCATLSYADEDTDTLTLDYWIDDKTKEAFRQNFDTALDLFQALQVLLTLNLYSVSDELKSDLYTSSSHYVNETVPTLASDERIMRFKHFYVAKKGLKDKMLLKEFSDGEHQLLHCLGLCLLFGSTNSLFLLDEPETHFNPSWRGSFISWLDHCLKRTSKNSIEMFITTHSPFLISDSTPDKVLIFSKDSTSNRVKITHPEYNTLGASINKITMLSFGKHETMGRRSEAILKEIRSRFDSGEAPSKLIDALDNKLGDSVEKVLLINAMLGRDSNNR